MNREKNSTYKESFRDAVGTVLAVCFVAAGLSGTACQSGQSFLSDETRQAFCDCAGLKFNP